jgi:hypothetical protein
MSDATPRLGLPWLMPAQAQKHVTVNESLGRLDALVQCAVQSRTEAVQPSQPGEGQAWILPADPSGADWAGFSQTDIAYFQDGAWHRIAARAGLTAWVVDEAVLLLFDGTGWAPFADGVSALANLTELGVGTAADGNNPFAAKLNSALWTARFGAEGGTGDLRYTLNKEAPGNVLSLLFQSGWSGRAELGLTGSDDLTVKVSADGAAWRQALRVDAQTGASDFAEGLSIAGVKAASLMFASGGDGVVSLWRLDAAHTAMPRSAAISAVSGDLITLNAPDAAQFTSAGIQAGVSYLRLWNSSKTPEESAWLKDVPDWGAGDQTLQVTDPADIAGWSSGDTVRIGERAANGQWVCAIDISPMLQQVFGAVFRQSGLMVKAALSSDAAGDTLALTPDGVGGSYVSAAQTFSPGVLAGSGVTIVACSELSPISNSNLVFVAERYSGAATTELISAVAVLR